LYSTDASVYQIMPLGVVIPKDENDIIATMRACLEFGVPLTPRGAGTSQAGQAVGAGVQLDCSKFFDRVLQIDAEERWVRVQPGCVLDDLNSQLRPLGLHFAPDVSTSNRATIGGMIGNNSCGAHSIIYGKTVDHVMELKVVLASGEVAELRAMDAVELKRRSLQPGLEGDCYRTVQRIVTEYADEIVRRFPRILRRVGGYNLDRFVSGAGADSPYTDPTKNPSGSFNLSPLLVGSEGTLGVTLEAKLRIVPLPRAKCLVVIHFGDLLEALAATPAILTHAPAAVEVVDKFVLDSTRLNADASRLRDFIQGDPAAILLVEFFGEHPDELQERAEELVANLAETSSGYHRLLVTESLAQQRIWKLRRAALGLSMAQKGDAKAISFVEDTAVAPEHLRDYISEFLAIVARHGTHAGVYAHASVGCLHVRPVINLKTERGIQQFERIAEEVAELVLKYGGALSGEHGDGLVRGPFQEKMYGPELYNAFRELKRTFDPHNLLNPGKVVDAPPLTANFRYGPNYVTPDIATTFDFTADGGFSRAAEQCAGVGACRKRRDGIMCPSYQATQAEKHSTRGRANALRLALSGQLGRDGLNDEALLEVFDLCLECKACKSECPTNVDMARAKGELLSQYYEQHHLPWRNYLFGNIARLGRLGCALAPFSNWWIRSRASRWLNDSLFGIDRRRMPPAFCRRSLTHRGVTPLSPLAGNGKISTVLLFVDTFTNYFEPAVGEAAIALFERLGASVALAGPDYVTKPGVRCCGRPLISNGLLGHAVHNARHNLAVLYPWAAAGASITACEPSCILTIKDDYPALLKGELRRQAETVAAACQSFEDCYLTLLSQAVPFQAGPKEIWVHGHCHQRSLCGMDSTLELLRHIPGAAVRDIDAGCCGMAGSFGYEKEHYEVSRLIGEQRLFSVLRASSPDCVVIASGFSCRSQIGHFTGRRALHPAELLNALLIPALEPPPLYRGERGAVPTMPTDRGHAH
jgi:FAD/FMN-containing dehydrogenase/Fe-S oxidoreductase